MLRGVYILKISPLLLFSSYERPRQKENYEKLYYIKFSARLYYEINSLRLYDVHQKKIPEFRNKKRGIRRLYGSTQTIPKLKQ